MAKVCQDKPDSSGLLRLDVKVASCYLPDRSMMLPITLARRRMSDATSNIALRSFPVGIPDERNVCAQRNPIKSNRGAIPHNDQRITRCSTDGARPRGYYRVHLGATRFTFLQNDAIGENSRPLARCLPRSISLPESLPKSSDQCSGLCESHLLQGGRQYLSAGPNHNTSLLSIGE